ncbi:MAG: DUF433 domain-containing protein [Chloroflexota bacterium]
MAEAQKEHLLERIELNPSVLAGKPIIRGMRLSVEQVLASLAAGVSLQELLEDYEGLTIEDIQAALYYAVELVSTERAYSLAI